MQPNDHPNKMAIQIQIQIQIQMQPYHNHYCFKQIASKAEQNTPNLNLLYPICMTQKPSNDDAKERLRFEQQVGVAPAAQFAPLASTFGRRLLTGVALGANFAGMTSFILGFWPETARSLKLDVLYPVGGFIRCKFDEYQGFEFVYPSNWVGDRTLLNRGAQKLERYLANDPRKNVNEPILAFGPPGSSGEFNVSVIVSPVPLDFSIEAFGGPKEVGEALIKKITGKRPNVKGMLIQSSSREDPSKKVIYYSLEFQAESSTFQRHNVAVFCATGGRLFTLNAQAPQSLWPQVKSDLYRIADSFTLT